MGGRSLLGRRARICILVAGPAVVVDGPAVGVHHRRDGRAFKPAVDVLGVVHILELGPSHGLLAERLQDHEVPIGVAHIGPVHGVPRVARPHPGGVEVELQGVVRGLGRGVHRVVHEHRLAGGDGDRDGRVDPRRVVPDGALLAARRVERDAVTGGDRGVVADVEGVRPGGERDVGAGASDHLAVDDDVRGLVGAVDHRPDVQVAVHHGGRVVAARGAGRGVLVGADGLVARAALTGGAVAAHREGEAEEEGGDEEGTGH